MLTHCNDCRKNTNHSILFSKRINYSDDEVPKKKNAAGKEYDDYMTIQCDGCNEISFLLRRHRDYFANENNSINYFDDNFPSNEFDSDVNLLDINEQEQLPRILYDLYQEVESAFNQSSNILAGVGLRMLVEAMCLEQKINGKNLQEKIRNLHTSGLISQSEVPILDKLRLIGNFSAHEIKRFSIDKLEYALDIINHVLKSIYILPKINKKLKI